MSYLDYAERPQPDNQQSFMPHELVFLGYRLHFTSYPLLIRFVFADSYSSKILQPFIAATVRIHSDAVFFSIVVSRMKRFVKN